MNAAIPSSPATNELSPVLSGGPAKPDKELSCEIVTDISRLEALGCEWERLWAFSEDRCVFQSLGWMKAFLSAYGRELELRTVLVWRGSELAGVLPLILNGAVLEFMGSQQSDYNDIICGTASAPDIIRTAFEALADMPGWRTCELNNVLSESRLVRNLAALPPGLRAQTAFRCPSPAIRAGENGSYADLFRKRNLMDHERKFHKLGEVTFRHAESRDDVFAHLDDFFEQQIARRAMLAQRSGFLNTGARDFFRALVKELDPAAALRFGILALDGRPVAYHFGFETSRKFFFYQTAFDIDFFSYRPGLVLLRRLLVYAHERRLVEFDLLNGGEEYKYRFANIVRQNLTVYVDRGGIHGRSSVALRRAALTASRCSQDKLRRYPAVYERLRGLARRFRQERARFQSLGAVAYFRDTLSRVAPSFTVSQFSIARESLSGRTLTHPGSATIEPLSLRALARMSIDHPALASQLESALRGLACGEKLYVLQCSEPTQIWAVTPFSAEAAGEPDSSRTAIVKECWSTRSPSNSSCSIVPHLMDILPKDTRRVILCCHRSGETAKHLKNGCVPPDGC